MNADYIPIFLLNEMLYQKLLYGKPTLCYEPSAAKTSFLMAKGLP
jgi:hypothetical protein